MSVPLPEAPIGRGAKWERVDERERGVFSNRTLELRELGPDGGTIVSTFKKKVTKAPVTDPRAAGATMEAVAIGTYTYAVRFDRIATSVRGELKNDSKVEIPGGGRDGEGATMVNLAARVIAATMRTRRFDRLPTGNTGNVLGLDASAQAADLAGGNDGRSAPHQGAVGRNAAVRGPGSPPYTLHELPLDVRSER